MMDVKIKKPDGLKLKIQVSSGEKVLSLKQKI